MRDRRRNMISEIIEVVNPPCSKCPYKLGIIHTVRNPCPECKTNGYKAYEWFTNQRNKQIN
jgi:hypothetical protein